MPLGGYRSYTSRNTPSANNPSIRIKIDFRRSNLSLFLLTKPPTWRHNVVLISMTLLYLRAKNAVHALRRFTSVNKKTLYSALK